jgi:hypothetical protein
MHGPFPIELIKDRRQFLGRPAGRPLVVLRLCMPKPIKPATAQATRMPNIAAPSAALGVLPASQCALIRKGTNQGNHCPN